MLRTSAHRIFHHRPRKRRGGFILVLVLMMLALITFAMTTLSTRSLRQAQLAVEAEREMQHRWRAFTLERLAFTKMPELLREIDRQNDMAEGRETSDQPPNQIELQVSIGSKRYRLLVADESSKLPIGALLTAFDTQIVFKAAEDLLPSNLYFADQRGGHPRSASHAFSQLIRSDAFVTNETVARAAGENLTLWGQGKLAFRRAAPEVKDAIWRILFRRPAPRRILELRMSSDSQLDLMTQLGLRESEARIAVNWLTSRSNQYSLWIIPEHSQDEPTRFSVRWGEQDQAMRQSVEY